MSSPLPVEVARRLGARVVVAVDVIYPPEDARLTSALRVLFQAFTISVYRLKQLELAGADFVIVPEMGSTASQWGFGERERLVAAGEKAALRQIERLRPLFLHEQRAIP